MLRFCTPGFKKKIRLSVLVREGTNRFSDALQLLRLLDGGIEPEAFDAHASNHVQAKRRIAR